jgi:parvulin-like peptidyl-prolyl isomerase
VTATAAPPSQAEVALQYIQRFENTTLATVNGEEITWEDYEPALRQTLLLVSQQYSIDWADAAMQQRLFQVQNDVLRQVVDRSLLRRMAVDQGVTVNEADVEAEVEREKAGIIESAQYSDWQTFLQMNGLTDESFRQVIYDTFLMKALMDAQVVESQAEQVRIAHIVVSDEATAQEVVAQLDAGGDFAQLAKQYSLDDQTKDSGGDLGWFTQEMMKPELVQTAFGLAVGGYSEPIATQGGYAVIMILAREMRELDSRALRLGQQDALMAQLEIERANAAIEFLVDFAADQE